MSCEYFDEFLPRNKRHHTAQTVPYETIYMIAITHWGRVTHICIGNLTVIGPDNGLSPGRRQAIIWTNAGILLIGPWGTNFSEILIGIQTFSFKKMHLKMPSAKWRPFCLGLNVIMDSLAQNNRQFVFKSPHCQQQRKHLQNRNALKTRPPATCFPTASCSSW